jgi:NhaA family Na+:H+ antiporter
MSLFITDLAFLNKELILQSKLGILSASMFASIVGYIIIRTAKSNLNIQ